MFVCLGNICRSPAAETILRRMTRDRQGTETTICRSSGLGAYHVGNPPDERMIEHAARRGYRMEGQAQVYRHERDFAENDFVVAMDLAVFEAIDRKPPPGASKEKLVLFTEFCDPPSRKGVPDPYYGGEVGFETVLDLIENGCRGIVERLANLERRIPR